MGLENQMAKPESDSSLYARLGAVIYDVGAPLVFLPVGGIDVLRERVLDTLEIRAGNNVLELGCGTGALTAKLIRRRANVIAVDQSEAMLRHARRRAPSAKFIRCDILNFKCAQKFDQVLIAFVLHHMEAKARISTLNLARSVLNSEGLIGILDWAEPDGTLLRWAVRTFIATVEPSSATDWIEQGFGTHLDQAGLIPIKSCNLAMGATKVVVAASDLQSQAQHNNSQRRLML
jgi:ubiquinone/menaquinone biosynthesis C-methylase UbiE